MGKLNIDEGAIVQIYEQCENCREIADMLGCSDETIRRVLIKRGIQRTHRHKAERHERKKRRSKQTSLAEWMQIIDDYYLNDVTIRELQQKYHRDERAISKAIKEHGHGLKVNERNAIKITNEELIACVNDGMSCAQIAARFSMSVERVFRRARKLNLHPKDQYQGGHWRRRSEFYGCKYFDSSITLDKVMKRDRGICQICGLYVDKTDIDRGHIRRMYPTVDHIIPLSKGGSHTWDNVQLAHMMCNSGKCDKTESR